MRREYRLTDEQLERLLEASKPTPAMWLSGGQPMFPSPQENANRAWQQLAHELGFVWDTVESVPGKGHEYFSAEPRPDARVDIRSGPEEMAT